MNAEKIPAELFAGGMAKTLGEITLLSESRIPVGMSIWAQLAISKVRSSPHYWSVRWLSSKLRALSRTDCKKTEVAGNLG